MIREMLLSSTGQWDSERNLGRNPLQAGLDHMCALRWIFLGCACIETLLGCRLIRAFLEVAEAGNAVFVAVNTQLNEFSEYFTKVVEK